MRTLIASIFVLIIACISAQAQDALVVTSCGNAPTGSAYSTPGSVAPLTVDTTGKLCVQGSLGGQTAAAISSDINPAKSLSNLVGKTAATVCIAGDSTTTVGPTLGNNVDPTQIQWFFLQNKLKDDNPQITSWTFSNFAIGGTNESQFTATGTTLLGGGLTLPSWFTPTTNTWSSFVAAANCDILFYGFGTNASTSGQPSGNSAATFINTNLTAIDAYTKIPNVIFITNKPTEAAIDNTDDANSSGHFAQAAFHRTFARTDAAGWTTFPKSQALGYGLVDLGRNFATQVYGYDPDLQYFQSKPGCVANGLTLAGAINVVGTQSYTVCTTTHGDYRMVITLPAEGGTTLYNDCGGGAAPALLVSGSQYAGNYLRLNIGGTGNIVPRYIVDGAISGAPSQVGTSVNTTNGNTVTITISLSGDRTQVTIQDGGNAAVLALDITAARFIGGAVGGTPINVGCANTTANSPTFNVVEFWEGIGVPTAPLQSQFQAYGSLLTSVGVASSCTVSNTNCKGGNGLNHIDSQSAMSDRAAIYALNFKVPPIGCTVQNPCALGVLKGANFNVTTDQAITLNPLTVTSGSFTAAATKYMITEIDVMNCSASLTAAQGGFYTATSKGGTIIGATTTAYTNCTSTTNRQRLTGITNMDTTTLTAAPLYLSLTTAQGSAATADVYVMGVPLN